jgi:hypothetical protein
VQQVAKQFYGKFVTACRRAGPHDDGVAANVLWSDKAVAAFAARFVTDPELFA